MIRIVTWNIQCGRGVDGVVDLDRIAATIRAMAGGEPDLICLQEVARHDADLDGAGADQVAHLAARFYSHTPFFGAALDRRGPSPSRRRQFGNLILARLPVLEIHFHPLPQPPDPTVKHMRRQAIEAIVASPGGPFRLITTHLEYHSMAQREAQVDRLRALQAEACAYTRKPPLDPGIGPYAIVPRPPEAVLCGDFNFGPDDLEFVRLIAPFEDGTAPFRDAWALCHGDSPHEPTCGIFDHKQWPQGAHCRDFFFVAGALETRVRGVAVDTQTAASDHQPVMLTLDF